MLTLDIPDSNDRFNVETQTFLPPVRGGRFQFEHSLKSLTLWEAKHRVPFLHTTLTLEQSLDYACMMCTTEIDPILITKEVLQLIIKYIAEEPTATTIAPSNDEHSGKVITAEVIYAWMANANVPFECDTWNLKKLMILLRVISAQNSKPKKRTVEEQIAFNRVENKRRREQLKSKG